MSLKPSKSAPKPEPMPRADMSGITRSRAQNPFNTSDNTDSSQAKSAPNPDGKKSSSLGTVLIAVGANVLIAVAKTFGAFITGSASMIAEAAHSWADAGNGTLLIVAE